jgi:nitrogen fixation NifU-like protein
MDENFDDFLDELQENILRDEIKSLPEGIVEHFTQPKNIGRMTDPDGAAIVRGQCGDTMEMYVVVEEGKISNILFYTDGCGITAACGSLTTELAKGQAINDALRISPADIIEKFGDSLEGSFHCAILAVITLHNALADYLLKNGM